MEVASVQQPSVPTEASNGAHATTNAVDASMDIDMDLDLGPLPEPEAFETEQGMTEISPDAAIDPLTEEAQYDKIHIRGVDELTTSNIKQFAVGHFSVEEPSRIEWIDDTSANIVYSSSEIGLQALSAFTQVNEEEDASALPALRLRTAKLLPSHPDSVLQVRSAVKTDRKKARAHESSRFYLMHPEHDPRERLRREIASDRRRPASGDSGDGDYRRRRFDGRELRRRTDRDADQIISANMYDDTGAASPEYSDADRGRDGRGRRGRRDLFAEDEGRSSGRLRDRSASPGRDTLMESGYPDEDRDSRRWFRERSPPSRRNVGRELFPSKSSGALDSDAAPRELFPNKSSKSQTKELFPSKVSNHRRSGAFDAADETADVFSRRLSIPLVDGAQDQQHSQRNRNVELFPDSGASGVNIRGAAGQDQGFSIRGAANGMSIKGRGSSVRELFPSKFKGQDNSGKELFSDKIEGRGGPRRRAEDMFS